MRGASGFEPDERLCFIEQPHSIRAHLQNVEIQVPRYMAGLRFWRASTLPLWQILAICIALVGMAFICNQHLNNLKAEVPRRRLAAKDEDPFESPPSPALDQLCSSLGPWFPAETSPGGLRKSPDMVEKFFKAIEAETISEAAPSGPSETSTMEALAGTAVRAPVAEPLVPSSSGGDDKEPNPSPKFSELESLLWTPRHPPPPSASVTALSALPRFARVYNKGRPQFTDPKPVFARLLPVSGNAPSTSTATLPPFVAQAPPGAPLHPFGRVPPLQPGVKPRPWVPSLSQLLFAAAPSSHPLLCRIRTLLLESSLDLNAADELIHVAEQLASYATRRLGTVTDVDSPADALRNYGLRFIILSSLQSATQAIRPTPPPWWQEVVDAMLKDYEFDVPAPWFSASGPNVPLARDLAEALLKYQKGGFPTLAEIVDLKRRLLCSPKAVHYFRRQEWEPWREDDKRYRVS